MAIFVRTNGVLRTDEDRHPERRKRGEPYAQTQAGTHDDTKPAVCTNIAAAKAIEHMRLHAAPNPANMRQRIAAAAFVCLLVMLASVSAARAQSVAFINPGKSDETYWVTATQGMQAAARSLGIAFEVQ